MTGGGPLTASPGPEARSRVGYVMTHYPRLAQTFIAGEIDMVERLGLSVQPFAINTPDSVELAALGASERAGRTIYLKRSLLAAAGILSLQTMRHPLAMARVWFAAVRSGGGHAKRTLRRLAHLAQAALVARQCAAQDIERLHAHFGLAPATIAWLASEISQAQGRRCAFSFTIHGFHDFVDRDEARLDLKAAAAREVVCISDFTRSQLCLFSDPALWQRYRVVRCGVDLAAFSYRDPRPLDGDAVLLAVGRLSPEKGLGVLIEAVAELRRDGFGVRLRLVGDGPQRAALAEQAQAAGIAEHVHFAGELPPRRVQEELRAADVFCMASFSEGLPVSLMEAMAVGVPVVTTWIAGIPELAEDDVTALTVPPARADRIAAAIARLCAEVELGPRLARAARARVEALHDQARSGAEMARILGLAT